MESKSKRWPLRLLVILVLGIGVLGMLGGRRPDNLGVENGKLADCPNKPNCVSTQATDAEHRIEPLSFEVDPAAMLGKVRAALETMPRTLIVTESDDYLYAECTTLLWRFVDDLEVWIDVENKLVHARSASRLGYSDLGANRNRVTELFSQIGDSAM